MKYLLVISAILAISSAYPFIDKHTHTGGGGGGSGDGGGGGGKRFRKQAVPVNQNTKYGLKDGVPYVEHKINLTNTADHKFDALASASKDFHNNKPLNAQGSLNYHHVPSGTGVQVGGSNLPNGGTNVNAAGVWNLYKNGGFGVDLKGGYSQNFGGPGGGGPPIYGVEIKGGYAFPRRG